MADAFDTAKFESQRRKVNDEYAASSASGAYSRFLSQQRGDRSVDDYQRGFKRSFPSFTAGFGQRGMSGGGVQSGVMQRAMQDHVGDYSRGVNRLNEDNAQSMRGFDLQQSQLDQWRNNALQDIELAKAREIAEAAQAISQLRPYMGS